MKQLMENWRKYLVENQDEELTDFIARVKEEFQLADLQIHIKKSEPWHPVESLYLSNIRAMEKGQGSGTKALQQIIQFAESKNLPITLIPIPENEDDVERLRWWYEEHGFEDWYREGPYADEDEEREHTKYMIRWAS